MNKNRMSAQLFQKTSIWMTETQMWVPRQETWMLLSTSTCSFGRMRRDFPHKDSKKLSSKWCLLVSMTKLKYFKHVSYSTRKLTRVRQQTFYFSLHLKPLRSEVILTKVRSIRGRSLSWIIQDFPGHGSYPIDFPKIENTVQIGVLWNGFGKLKLHKESVERSFLITCKRTGLTGKKLWHSVVST